MDSIKQDNKYFGEKNVLKMVQECILERKEAYPVNLDNSTLEYLRNALIDKESWINSSGKADATPDFYSPKHNLMIEVMNVDDNTHLDNGKPIDPVKINSSRMMKELRYSGILENISPEVVIFTNPACLDLSTEEYHNYDQYLASFKRIVGKHIEEIPTYRSNHPGMKLAFLIMDESAAYLELPIDRSSIHVKPGFPLPGCPHLHFADGAFLSDLVASDVDYLLWYTPYKVYTIINEGIFPMMHLCIFDLKNNLNCQEYDPKRMMCSEF